MDEATLELAERVGDALRDASATVSVAESCTGGLVGGALTAIAGSSDYVDTGVVTYSYGSKRRHLAVSREALDEHGAVSAPVASEMARGVRDVTDSTWGLATTGIAGPAGGTEETPVGTVFVGLAYAAPWGTGDSRATVTRHAFEGDRAAVRAKTVTAALERLLEGLEGEVRKEG